MTDICERLRHLAMELEPSDSHEAIDPAVGWCNEAADEIERLRAQVAEGRELLVEIREDRYWGRDVKDIEKMDAYLAKTK